MLSEELRLRNQHSTTEPIANLHKIDIITEIVNFPLSPHGLHD
jgi:hypothetical protein